MRTRGPLAAIGAELSLRVWPLLLCNNLIKLPTYLNLLALATHLPISHHTQAIFQPIYPLNLMLNLPIRPAQTYPVIGLLIPHHHPSTTTLSNRLQVSQRQPRRVHRRVTSTGTHCRVRRRVHVLFPTLRLRILLPYHHHFRRFKLLWQPTRFRIHDLKRQVQHRL